MLGIKPSCSSPLLILTRALSQALRNVSRPRELCRIRSRQVRRSSFARDFARALTLLRQSLRAAETEGDHPSLMACHQLIGGILFEDCRFFKEAAVWYWKAALSAIDAGQFSRAAECIKSAGHSCIETGDFEETARLLEGGIGRIGDNLEGIAKAQILGQFAFAESHLNSERPAETIKEAWMHLTMADLEAVLEWSLAYGRLFVRVEKFDLAVMFFDRAMSSVREKAYYSKRVNALFQEYGRILYLLRRFTSSLIEINDGRNRAYANGDMDSVCYALVHSARIYKELGELSIAEMEIRRAMDLAKTISFPLGTLPRSSPYPSIGRFR